MMAGRIKSRRTLTLLILLSLLSLTQLFEVKDEWDIAAPHRLRGLSEHTFHERLKNPSAQRVDTGQSVRGQRCAEGFACCGTQTEQRVDEQKISASEISHSRSQTLLLMTDEEKPAEDRVQQESSMSPHYSVLVSKECLFNGSCVPETVVKMFGRVSEDGQTVSGLKAVLETNQENPQIYQVMAQPDSVPLSLTPQRPVDHRPQYDHQQILMMQDDPTVRKAATSLYEKRPTVTSVYALDENQRPELIHGASVPLSEDSRLTLVGHGERDRSGEMRLAGYTAQDVAKIIQHTFRTGDRIKTTSVVACEVGSDEEFAGTLLRALRETANIETELHLRNAVLQVRHTGEIITQEISEQGVQWRLNDDSKKVLATLDSNGDVIIRSEPGRRGEEVFTNERNFLKPTASPTVAYRDSWPAKPRRFIDQDFFKLISDANMRETAKTALTELTDLEALSWAYFHEDLPLPQRVNTDNLDISQNYIIGEKREDEKKQLVGITWIEEKKKEKQKKVISECYDIKTARDIRSIIRHYAKDGDDVVTHLMVKDWIYAVDPVSLYVYPVGKKLDQNQREEVNKNKVKRLIEGLTDKVRYEELRPQIKKTRYANYVKAIFRGEETFLQLGEVAYTTYFTASVIAESARNFRTFPLILMAVEMVENRIKEGEDFLNDEHSMARGGSWINPGLRGFSGSATPNPSSIESFKEVIRREVQLYNSWKKTKGIKELDDVEVDYKIALQLIEGDPVKNYKYFKDEMNKKSVASASGR